MKTKTKLKIVSVGQWYYACTFYERPIDCLYLRKDGSLTSTTGGFAAVDSAYFASREACRKNVEQHGCEVSP